MNAGKLFGIVAVTAASVGFVGTVIANEAAPAPTDEHSYTDINGRPATQPKRVEPAATNRSGVPARLGSDNSAAQLGSSLNGNPGAQLNNETNATSAPPVDSDSNTPDQPAAKDTDSD